MYEEELNATGTGSVLVNLFLGHEALSKFVRPRQNEAAFLNFDG